MNKARNRSSAKERIIKAYLRLLTQGKHRKVTVSAVAKAAECNRDTFYYYFASIDALAKCALDELAPVSVPHIAVALAEGNALTIPEQAKARMRIIAKIARAHPRIRKHLEGALKNLWITELRIDLEKMEAADESVLDFMAAGTVGFVCEHLAERDEDSRTSASEMPGLRSSFGAEPTC